MDYFSNYFTNTPRPKNLFDASDLSPKVQNHLVCVYATLGATIFAAAAGVIAEMKYHLAGSLSYFAVFGLLILLGMNQGKPNMLNQQLATLLAFGFFKGVSIAPLINMALIVDPSLVATAFGATTAVFASFSLSALLSKRRSYLYLGGMLGSTLMIMCLGSLINMFVRIPFLYDVSLYLGLAVFSGYVLYDTQLIVEKAAAGNFDFVMHSLELFIDFVAIFVRILIILMKNKSNKTEKKSNSNNRR